MGCCSTSSRIERYTSGYAADPPDGGSVSCLHTPCLPHAWTERQVGVGQSRSNRG